ncbi:MAG: Cache domain-containing protein [Leptolyngbyaceae cyanobacterium MAG.088]|nr:Cache domain-containing protein [Leptolyngbyaceae cyanobacterium MAG.088]
MTPNLSTATQAESASTSHTPTQQSQQQRLKQFLMRLLRLNFFGGRLFWMIMLGALAGIGGMAFLFSEMIKYQAEDQVQSTLDGKVNAIASVTVAAETLANGLGISATTLHERQAQYPDTYRELTLQLFEKRPDFVVGLGLGQRENGLIVNQSWLFPYYSVDSASEPQSSPDQSSIQYENFADGVGEFYPESDRYLNYFLPQRTVWTQPYEANDQQLLTYYLPLFDSAERWLGTTLVDIDGQYLSDLLNQPVFRQQGAFRLLTYKGNIIADPENPDNNLKTYETIPDLKDLWKKIDFNDTGFLEGETGYWAYATVPDHDWLVVGFVPYSAVFNRVALITLVATVLMVTLLSTAIVLAIRSLNHRLRPILDQCNLLAKTDSLLLAQWDEQDELNQLSLAFFNMLKRLNLNKETIRYHEQTIEKETFQLDQVSEQLVEFARLLNQSASEQQTLVRNTQQLVAGAANDSQSIDLQLDAINTMGRALDGELRRMPTHTAETLILVERQVQALTNALNDQTSAHKIEQLHQLVHQLAKNVMTLKAIEQRWPSADRLQEQTESITQASRVATEDARSVVMSIQSVDQMLVKIEQISTMLLQRARTLTKAKY